MFGKAPELTRSSAQALEVWRFCGGWNPAVLELAVAYYEIEDVELLLEQLAEIRDTIDAYRAALQKARKKG